MNLFVGYLQFDDREFAVRNPVTGQKLKFIEYLETGRGITTNSSRQWISFLYSDEDVSCPVLVECVFEPGSFGAVWFLDYSRSDLSNISYGLWLRIDTFAVDALEYFSFSEKLGRPSAREIAAIGGWYLWQWQNEVVRTQRSLRLIGPKLIESKIISAYLPPLDLEPPSAWTLTPANETPEKLSVLRCWETAALKGLIDEKIYFTAHNVISRSSHFVHARGTRILVPVPPDDRHESDYSTMLLDASHLPPEREQRFLYFDENCLLHPLKIERLPSTDGLELKITCSKSPGLEGLGLAFLSGDAAGGELRLSESPRSLHQERLIAIPEWVEYRVREACLGAIAASSRDASRLPATRIVFSVGSYPEGHDRESILSNIKRPGVNSDSDCTKEPSTSNELSVLPSLECLESRLQQTHGSWCFAPCSTTLFNAKTSQSVTLSEAVDVPTANLPSWLEKPTWWQLTYKDPETSYSIPVARGAESASAAMFVPFFFRPPFSYGLWRRLQLAIVDALSSWPQPIESVGSAGQIMCLGGWASETWHNNLLVETTAHTSVLETQFLDQVPLPDLHTKAPSAWELVGSSTATGEAWLSGLSWEKPTGTSTRNEKHYFAGKNLKLDGVIERPISGFQGKTPYLRRKNGSAVFLPAQLISTCASDLRGEFHSYASRIVCIYADQDFSAIFLQKTMEHLTFDIQDAALNPRDRFQTLLCDSSKGRGKESRELVVPDWQQWCSMMDKLMDIGVAWRGSQAKLSDDPQRLEKLQSIQPHIWDGWDSAGVQSLGPCSSNSVIGYFSSGGYQPDRKQIIHLMDKSRLR